LGKRLNELAVKRSVQRLSEKEEQEFSNLRHLVDVFTAEEVSSYEQNRLNENVRVAPQKEFTTPQSQGEIDSSAINAFLVKPPIPETRTPVPTQEIPQDANMRYVVLENGDFIEVGTGRKVDEGVSEMQVLGNDYYLLTKTRLVRIDNSSVTDTELVKLKDGFKEILTSRDSGRISSSPDKKWVVCLAEEGELQESFAFDVSFEEKYFTDTFSRFPLFLSSVPSSKYANPQFSRDGI
jgi:hypothetical protein